MPKLSVRGDGTLIQGHKTKAAIWETIAAYFIGGMKK